MIPIATVQRAMRALFTVIVIVTACASVPAQDSEALTSDDIITLVKAGLPSAVIVAKISSSSTDFDTSVDALLALSAESIPPDVLTAMAEAGKQAPAPSPSPVAPAPPTVSAQPGTATIRRPTRWCRWGEEGVGRNAFHDAVLAGGDAGLEGVE